jgi:hypothetical protein
VLGCYSIYSTRRPHLPSVWSTLAPADQFTRRMEGRNESHSPVVPKSTRCIAAFLTHCNLQVPHNGRRLDKKWGLLPWPCGSAHSWANHRGAFQCPPAVDSFLECSLMPVRAFPRSEPNCRDGTPSLREPSRSTNRWTVQQILNNTGPDTSAP